MDITGLMRPILIATAATSAPNEKTPVLQGDASGCDHPRDGQVPPAGFEQSDEMSQTFISPDVISALLPPPLTIRF